jgi:hypothetical protein
MALNNRQAGQRVNETGNPRSAFSGSKAKGHLLNDKSQARIRRGSSGLTQQPCGSGLPGARHAAQYFCKLFGGVLGKRFLCFGFEQVKRAQNGGV